MHTILPVDEGNSLKALQAFLQKLLESGVVEGLLVAMRTPWGTVSSALVTDPQKLDQADPLAPVMPGNNAALAGKLSARQPRPKIGVVLRPCELRALVELAKLQQASLDDLLLIALDCAGTYSPVVYLKQNGDAAGWQALFSEASENPEASHPGLRSACRICEHPVYDGAQVSIELYGCDPASAIPVNLPDELGARLGLVESGQAALRRPIIDRLVEARLRRRDEEFAALRLRLEGEEGLAGVFAACIRCHNCMTVCPICYCKTCVFKSPVFDHDPMQYMTWARQKGAFRLPPDTLLFHLTRLNHMGLSCVGCGMCTEACPSEIPVGMVFRSIAQRLQSTFDYEPGRKLDEPLPLITFKADEWNEVGE